MNLSFQGISNPLKIAALAFSLGFLPFDQLLYLEQKSFLLTASPAQASISASVDGNTAALNPVKESVDLTANPTADIPTAQQWQTHIQQDLLPFWGLPDG
ncbi:MAG: hypothetical protein AAF579_04725 [Cyanobacteria bacterium P01_C01_bin.118]